MLHRRRLLCFGLLAGALTGCTNTVDVAYAPPAAGGNATAASRGPAVVTVGTFTDRRNEPANWLGTIRGGFGNPLKTLETSRPVVDVVAQAFKDGLAARGMTAPDDTAARYRLEGVVDVYDADQYVRRESNTDIEVRLVDLRTSRTVATKRVRRNVVDGPAIALSGVFASVEDLRATAARALQETVDEALNAPELTQALR